MIHTRLIVAGLVLTAATSATAAPPAPVVDPKRIEELTGAKGALDAEGVFKVSVPRTDLTVAAAGVHLTPPMGLTSWAAFQAADAGQLMVMGDLVLLEDQVNPVMSVALDNGLEVTALHNHFFWDTPKVMFMHVGGRAAQDALATAVGKVFARIKDTSGGAGEGPKADIDPARSTLTAAPLDVVLGVKGDLSNGVYKVTVGRTTRMHGHAAGKTMGVNTWAAFAGSPERAVVDGDVAMHESELQPVLKALRHAGILIVAIHQHMSGEEPRILFLHYWGLGPAESLARAVRAALDLTADPK